MNSYLYYADDWVLVLDARVNAFWRVFITPDLIILFLSEIICFYLALTYVNNSQRRKK